MACRGVHFALTVEQELLLLSKASDEEILELIQEDIEAKWDEEFLQETDKAWDGIHRCLTDGTLSFDSGSYPLNKVILGGQLLYKGDDYIVSYVPTNEVHDIAKAISQIDENQFRERFFQINFDDFGLKLIEENFEYHWEWFDSLKEFYQKASETNRAVIFTVDQ